MPDLKPAGILDQLLTLFVPKVLKAEARTEVLPNGQVEVTPIYEIDGREIPPELIAQESSQRILGYQVALSASVLCLHRMTHGKRTRLSKSKAPAFLDELKKSNVSVRARDGKTQPRIARVKPEITLTLQPDDSLLVQPDLVSPEGLVPSKAKAQHSEQLKQDDGWYAVGDDLIGVTITNTPLDSILISPGAKATLTGDDVPSFLKLLQKHSNAVSDVEKNEPLQSLSVFGETTENRARVDGDFESISVAPVLVFQGPKGKQYEANADGLKDFEQDGGFRRVADGWIDVSQEAVQDHLRACRELTDRIGELNEIRGTDIPEVLTSLFQAASKGSSWSTPWTVYFSKSVKDSHRIIETPAVVQFRLNIIDSDGQSLLELDPIYNHERFQVTYAETEAATAAGEGWIRRRDAWVKLDADKQRRIANEVVEPPRTSPYKGRFLLRRQSARAGHRGILDAWLNSTLGSVRRLSYKARRLSEDRGYTSPRVLAPGNPATPISEAWT